MRNFKRNPEELAGICLHIIVSRQPVFVLAAALPGVRCEFDPKYSN